MVKIVLTGASGFIGQQLVPRLHSAGAELLLVGRTPDRLKTQFPDHAACSYEDLAQQGQGFDLLVHLAVHNSDAGEDQAQAHQVNVVFQRQVLELAKTARITRFVDISSVQALDRSTQSAYAISKRTGTAQLQQITGIEVSTLYLPLVYGDRFAGKLARLNTAPKALSRLLWPGLAALKPTLHVDRLATHIMAGADTAIPTDGQHNNLVYRGLKRIMDLGFALVVIGLLWWALLGVWIAIKLTSTGPGIFAQPRIGRHGAPFICYKFRTMAVGTAQAGTHEVSADAVTKIGHFLRATKLDELPQVLNILRGELSLIGPRPCLPVQTDLIAARNARGVLQIRPGISGLAQIEGIDMSDPEVLAKRDADYIALQSLVLDLKITLATATGSGQGDKTKTSES